MPDKESLYPMDWFAKADNDLRATKVLLSASNLESAAFHIQQTIEKYLKGYLLSQGWRLRRIHELDALLDEAVLYHPDMERFRALCETATEYYIEDRYPFLLSSQLNREELEKILKETVALIEFIKANLRIC